MHNLILIASVLAIAFILGWIMSREWAAHTIRNKGVLRVNYTRFKCYEVIDDHHIAGGADEKS